jgi:hypothetical protein
MLLCFAHASANQPEEALEELRKHNTEIADAWHFLLELLIYLGYDERLSRVFRIMDVSQFNTLIDDDNALKSMLNIGAYLNFSDGLNNRGLGNYNIVGENTYDDVDSFNLGNKRISKDVLDAESIMLWNITFYLHMMTNELKSKDWVQGDKTLNLVRLEQALGNVLLAFGQYLDYGQFTQIGIRYYYLMKNNENMERIKTGY